MNLKELLRELWAQHRSWIPVWLLLVVLMPVFVTFMILTSETGNTGALPYVWGAAAAALLLGVVLATCLVLAKLGGRRLYAALFGTNDPERDEARRVWIWLAIFTAFIFFGDRCVTGA